MTIGQMDEKTDFKISGQLLKPILKKLLPCTTGYAKKLSMTPIIYMPPRIIQIHRCFSMTKRFVRDMHVFTIFFCMRQALRLVTSAAATMRGISSSLAVTISTAISHGTTSSPLMNGFSGQMLK